MRKLTVLIGLLLLGWVIAGWVAPDALPGFMAPGVPGLDPGYTHTYTACGQALKTGQPDEALAIVDEFLLGPGASGPDAQTAWGLRAQTLARGAALIDSPADRGQMWRVLRVAGRRPLTEWIVLATAFGFLAGAALSRLRDKRVIVDTYPIGPRPWQNLPKPMMD